MKHLLLGHITVLNSTSQSQALEPITFNFPLLDNACGWMLHVNAESEDTEHLIMRKSWRTCNSVMRRSGARRTSCSPASPSSTARALPAHTPVLNTTGRAKGLRSDVKGLQTRLLNLILAL